MRRIDISLSVVILCLAALIILSKTVTADSPVSNDLSWPNCGEEITSLSETGVVGVNDGLDFSINPCLGQESQLFHNNYALYLNTGYPGKSYGLKYKDSPRHCMPTDFKCLAYNFGYNAALYSIKNAERQDTHSFVWWLDVETENSWTNNANINRQALFGMVAAVKEHTFMPTIGFYSYPGQWQSITNNWHNFYPAWVATTSSTKAAAASYCQDSMNGGPVWLTQYINVLDANYNCLSLNVNILR